MRKIAFLTLMVLVVIPVSAQTFSDHTYTPSDALILNPERGLSAYKSSAVSVSYGLNLRAEGLTIAQRMYNYGTYRTDSLPAAIVTRVENDLINAREAGIKLVMRYRYTTSQTGEDAPLEWILTHIEQLGPIWMEHHDAIAYIEAGWIGAWGEWYYSSNGLNNTEDRRSVLFKELQQLHTDRMVVVRTPDYKRNIFGYDEPLGPDSAFSGSYRARTGAHNDCFLASATDYGTYGNIEEDKTYLNLDNRYVPQGGETCNPSSYSGCENALIDLNRMHWSVLNRDYHPAVIEGWQDNGCWDEIQRRLGYRFELQEARIQDEVRPGGALNLDLTFFNDGFASPYNPRNCEIVIRNTATEHEYTLISDADPRWWLGGDSAEVSISGGIPENLPEGQYAVYLHLSDPAPLMRYRPEFSIQLANEGIWEAETGYNDLVHTLTVSASAAGDDYTGDLWFEFIEATSVFEHPAALKPGSFELRPGYPNPFNGNYSISFDVYESTAIGFEVFNHLGQRVDVISVLQYEPGNHALTWHPKTTLSSGHYYIRAGADGEFTVQKLVYLK